MPDGNLRIPTTVVTDDGESLCGYEEVDTSHPRYDEWLELISQRGPLLDAARVRREERKEESEKRREGRG
jgi:hypothetical protein